MHKNSAKNAVKHAKPKQRTRTRDGTVFNSKCGWVQTHLHPGETAPTVTSGEETDLTNGAKSGEYQSMTDWVTPQYSRHISNGEVLNYPMVSFREKFTPGYSTLVVRATHPLAPGCQRVTIGNLGTLFDSHGGLGPSKMVYDSLRPALGEPHQWIDEVALKTFGNVQSPKILSLVALAEMEKTVSLIGDTAYTLGRAYRKAKAGDLRGAREALHSSLRARNIPFKEPKRFTPSSGSLDSTSKRWLELRYGWGPLYYDTVGAAEALAASENFVPRQTARAGLERSSRQEWTEGPYSPLSRSNQGAYNFRFTQVDNWTIRGYCLYDADPIQQRLGNSGLFNVLSTGWELIPFSFVVDWFVQIGDYIAAWEPKFGVRYLATGYTIEQKTTLHRVVSAYTNPPDVDNHNYRELTSLIGFTDTYECVKKHRAVPLILPLLPSVRVKLNAKRVIDAAALLRVLSR